MKYLFYLTIFIIGVSCKNTTKLQTFQHETIYGKVDIVLAPNKKANINYLIIPDDDTVSISEQISFLNKVLPQKSNKYFFPKLYYQNEFDKTSYDNPLNRINFIVDAYNELLANKTIDSTLEIIILGIGEGSVVAPQIATNMIASEMILINPHVLPLSQDMYAIFSAKGKSYEMLSKFSGLRTTEDWHIFLKNAAERNRPDDIPTNRQMTYYHTYWMYNPEKFISIYSNKTRMIVFTDYSYTSELNKSRAKKIRPENSSLINGAMFTIDTKDLLEDALR